jgi:hypothetical protein
MKEFADFQPVNPWSKSSAYTWQKEFRFVWPSDVVLEVGPVFEVPKIKQFVSRIR